MENQNQFPKKRKSRIFQFGIRSLLVLIVVSSLVTRFGFLSWQQKQAIGVIRTYGGAVFLSHQSPVYDYPAMFGAPNISQPPDTGLRAWCRARFSPELAETAEVVYFTEGFNADNPELIDAINHLRGLKILVIRSSDLGDPGFVGKLKSIERLALFNGNFDKNVPLTDLTEICKLTKLKTLSLSAKNVDSLKQIQKLNRLEQLHLPFAKLNSLAPLENMTQLKWLNIDPTNVDDISPLSKLVNLEVLRFGLADVSPERMKEIKKMLPNCKVGRF